MFKAIWRIVVIFSVAWKFRKMLWELINELDTITKSCDKFSAAYNNGVDGLIDAKSAVRTLLQLNTCRRFVETTESTRDNVSLDKMIQLLDNKVVCSIAWRVLLGDWGFNVKQNHWSMFVDRVKFVIPYIDKTKAITALAAYKQQDDELSDQNEAEVVELVGLFYLLAMSAPKVACFKL